LTTQPESAQMGNRDSSDWGDRLQKVALGGGLLSVLLISFLLRLLYTHSAPLSYDETHNLMFAVLSEHGYVPYEEVFIGIAPFALLTVQLGVKLWGTVVAVRYPMILLGLLGIGAMLLLVVRQSKAKPIAAGLVASLLFSFNLHYFLVSSSINLEGAALSLAVLSVAVAEYYRVNPRWVWLFSSGVCFALSISIKMLVPFVPLIVCAQLLLHLTRDRQSSLFERDTYIHLLKLGCAWGVGVLLVLGIFLTIYDPQALYHQVVEFRFVLREAASAQSEDVQLTTILSFEDWLQYAPLLVGAVITVVKRRRELDLIAIWLLWFAVGLVLIASYSLVRSRHTVVILPPLAALSGMAVASLIAHFSRTKRLSSLTLLVIILCGIFYAPIQAIAAEKESFEESRLVRQVAIDYIQQTTASDDCVIAKENRLNFAANRLTPPYLSEISTGRILIGWLSPDEIIAGADAYDCPVFVDSPTFGELVPELRQMAGSLYSLRLRIKDPTEGRRMVLYVVKMNTHKAPVHSVDRSLGDEILLKGYDMSSEIWQRGRPATLSIYWQAEREIDRDYKVFLFLADERGQPVQSFDHYPFEARPEYYITDVSLNSEYLEGDPFEVLPDYPNRGLIPTRLWLPGNTLRETVAIVVSSDVPSGTYQLNIGMYDEATMERLTIGDGLAGSEVDQILLATVQVE
jgi:hypothetical protein